MSAPNVDGPVRLDPSRPELPPDALADRRRGIGFGMCEYTGYARLGPRRETPVPIVPVDEPPAHWPVPARADLPGWLVVALVVAAALALAAIAVGGVR